MNCVKKTTYQKDKKKETENLEKQQKKNVHNLGEQIGGVTKWLPPVRRRPEVTQKTYRKKKSFRKIETIKDGLYFVNVETGEPVWNVPADGEIVV